MVDIIGNKYNQLTVISYSHMAGTPKRRVFLCKCECGKTTLANITALRKGYKKSCGCLHRASARELCISRSTHNMSMSPEYNSWLSMRVRCCDEQNSSYQRYGGRGIKVCEQWLNSFENFYADMGPRPSSSHSIDRIDNDGDYEPSNCKWSTKLEQLNNTSRVKKYMYNGEYLTIPELCRKYGHDHSLVQRRVREGKSLDDAIRLARWER